MMTSAPRSTFCVAVAAVVALTALGMSAPVHAQEPGAWDNARIQGLLDDVEERVQERAVLAQQMVDKIFSFSELGFQEIETSRYIVSVLREHGFEVEEGIAGIPTSWWATWGSGGPVISLGSDIDGIPKASQTPGVAYLQPLVEGGPGHGEGHNSGQGLNVVAAIALKEVMERENIPGTIVLWPGVAEEQVATKAWLVRDGYFDGVDAAIFTHVGNNMGVTWGDNRGTGLVSAEFTFRGEAAHGASAWRGRSGLDAVELMNVAWNVWREHMRPLQRSHHVITDGGDQPNVVPNTASVWYFVREMDFEHIQENFAHLVRIAEGAALQTQTEMEYRILGTAAPRHFNRPIAEAMWKHIETVGLPEWSENDQALAIATQLEVGGDPRGLPTELDSLQGPPDEPQSGGSDDIGDISWQVPTVTLRFPSNIRGLPGHHWSNAISMATPIAHKGVVAGARVLARSVLEMYLNPRILEDAWGYFDDVQTAEQQGVGRANCPQVYILRAERVLCSPRDRYGPHLSNDGVIFIENVRPATHMPPNCTFSRFATLCVRWVTTIVHRSPIFPRRSPLVLHSLAGRRLVRNRKTPSRIEEGLVPLESGPGGDAPIVGRAPRQPAF
jgi:aminobenzoyl-glutamate utilization protein B